MTDAPLPRTYVVMAIKERHQMTARLLLQLEPQLADDNDIFILDNGSETPFPDSIERPASNLSALWNEGLHEAAKAAGGAPHNVAVLNNDLEVPPDFVSKLARGLRQRDDYWIAYPNWEDLDIPDGMVLPVTSPQHHLSGWAFMLRGEAGLRFDEQFEWYYGDNDIQRQVAAAGRQVVCVGGASCVHLEPGRSTSTSPELQAKAQADAVRYERKWDPRAEQ